MVHQRKPHILYTVLCDSLSQTWLDHKKTIDFLWRFILLIFSSCCIQISLSQFDINNIVNISQSEDQLFQNQTDGEITQENTLSEKADQDEVDLTAACDETNPSIKICWCCKLVCSVIDNIKIETLPHRWRTVHVLDLTFSYLLIYFYLAQTVSLDTNKKKPWVNLIIMLHFMWRFLVFSGKKGFDRVVEDLHAQCTLLPVAVPIIGRWSVLLACGIGV